MTKILVIEDDPVLKENVIDILQEESFQAIDASNGMVGLKLAKEHQPDLILCDVMMPHMDGYEVLQNLKQNYYTSSIPFIFITSKTSRQFWRKGMELGADDYLTKPFTPEELLKTIILRSSYSQLSRRSRVENSQLVEYKTIFNFDSNTNLPSKFCLQGTFEDLVKKYLLANVNSWQNNGRINFKIPFLCVNISNFAGLTKFLNDNRKTTLLKLIAERLLIGTFARGIVTHLQKGMFAVILPSVEKKTDVIAAIERIHQHLTLPFESYLNLPQLFLHICTGVSFYPDRGTNLHTIIEQAKDAVKSAKNQHRDYVFYKPKGNFFNSLSLERDILQKFKKQELQLLYQPQFCLKTSQIISYAANISMPYQNDGLFFSKLASIEKHKLIATINLWYWEQACKHLTKWQQKQAKSLKLSVKVAKTYFYRDTFNLDIAKLIKKYSLSYGFLELEICEQTLLSDKQQALHKLNGLKNLGVNITLDKFASGYSNLEYWQEFPIDRVKLHWANLQRINDLKRCQEIVKVTATLAHSAGIKAIATGITTSQDLQLFTKYNWDIAQGNYWGKPFDAPRFI